MNQERITALAERIANLADPSDYDHSRFGGYQPKDDEQNNRGCQTRCCFAGHAVLMMLHADRDCRWQDDANRINSVTAKAASYLELDEGTMSLLVDFDSLGGLTEVTPPVVAAVLRILAQTGEVRWDEAAALCYDGC